MAQWFKLLKWEGGLKFSCLSIKLIRFYRKCLRDTLYFAPVVNLIVKKFQSDLKVNFFTAYNEERVYLIRSEHRYLMKHAFGI